MSINDRSDQTVRRYVRGAPPVNYENPEDLLDWLQEELDRIQEASSEHTDSAPQVADAEPLNPRKGMIRYVVAPWDPLGDGVPQYVVYDGSAWTKLLVGSTATASDIAFTPEGTIAATDVQAAIAELDSETQTALGTKVPTTRTITAGVALAGGGDLSANRTIDLDITELTEDTSPATGDFVATYDVSAGAHKKVTLTNVLALVSSGDVWTQITPVATTSGTSVTIAAAGTIPSTAKKVVLLLKGISTNAANTAPILIMTNGGGDIASGYGVSARVPTSAAQTPSNHISLSSSDTEAAWDAADLGHVVLEFTRMDPSNAVWAVSGFSYSSQFSNQFNAIFGWLNFSSDFTGLRVTTSAGTATFDAGTAYLAYFD